MNNNDLIDTAYDCLEDASLLLRALLQLSGEEREETIDAIEVHLQTAFYCLNQIADYLTSDLDDPLIIERPNVSYEDQIDVALEFADRFEDMLWESTPKQP